MDFEPVKSFVEVIEIFLAKVNIKLYLKLAQLCPDCQFLFLLSVISDGIDFLSQNINFGLLRFLAEN